MTKEKFLQKLERILEDCESLDSYLVAAAVAAACVYAAYSIKSCSDSRVNHIQKPSHIQTLIPEDMQSELYHK